MPVVQDVAYSMMKEDYHWIIINLILLQKEEIKMLDATSFWRFVVHEKSALYLLMLNYCN